MPAQAFWQEGACGCSVDRKVSPIKGCDGMRQRQGRAARSCALEFGSSQCAGRLLKDGSYDGCGGGGCVFCNEQI